MERTLGNYHQYNFVVGEDGTVHGTIEHAGYEKPYQKIMVRNAVEEKEIWKELSVTE